MTSFSNNPFSSNSNNPFLNASQSGNNNNIFSTNQMNQNLNSNNHFNPNQNGMNINNQNNIQNQGIEHKQMENKAGNYNQNLGNGNGNSSNNGNLGFVTGNPFQQTGGNLPHQNNIQKFNSNFGNFSFQNQNSNNDGPNPFKQNNQNVQNNENIYQNREGTSTYLYKVICTPKGNGNNLQNCKIFHIQYATKYSQESLDIIRIHDYQMLNEGMLNNSPNPNWQKYNLIVNRFPKSCSKNFTNSNNQSFYNQNNNTGTSSFPPVNTPFSTNNNQSQIFGNTNSNNNSNNPCIPNPFNTNNQNGFNSTSTSNPFQTFSKNSCSDFDHSNANNQKKNPFSQNSTNNSCNYSQNQNNQQMNQNNSFNSNPCMNNMNNNNPFKTCNSNNNNNNNFSNLNNNISTNQPSSNTFFKPSNQENPSVNPNFNPMPQPNNLQAFGTNSQNPFCNNFQNNTKNNFAENAFHPNCNSQNITSVNPNPINNLGSSNNNFSSFQQSNNANKPNNFQNNDARQFLSNDSKQNNINFIGNNSNQNSSLVDFNRNFQNQTNVQPSFNNNFTPNTIPRFENFLPNNLCMPLENNGFPVNQKINSNQNPIAFPQIPKFNHNSGLSNIVQNQGFYPCIQNNNPFSNPNLELTPLQAQGFSHNVNNLYKIPFQNSQENINATYNQFKEMTNLGMLPSLPNSFNYGFNNVGNSLNSLYSPFNLSIHDPFTLSNESQRKNVEEIIDEVGKKELGEIKENYKAKILSFDQFNSKPFNVESSDFSNFSKGIIGPLKNNKKYGEHSKFHNENSKIYLHKNSNYNNIINFKGFENKKNLDKLKLHQKNFNQGLPKKDLLKEQFINEYKKPMKNSSFNQPIGIKMKENLNKIPLSRDHPILKEFGIKLEKENDPKITKNQNVSSTQNMERLTLKDSQDLLKNGNLTLSKLYETSPSQLMLSKMNSEELSRISKFSVWNEFGKIIWENPVDLNCYDIDNEINISSNEIEVYGKESSKWKIGEKLNGPATCILYDVDVKDKDASMDENISYLKEVCKSNEIEFIDFKFDTESKKTIFTFKVKHFSKYSFYL